MKQMADLAKIARELIRESNDSSQQQVSDAAREFIETVTFSSSTEISAMLRREIGLDWMALPVWARNLSYRLACLQDPENAELLNEAAIDLYSFGPDWDDHASELAEHARALKEEGTS
ncbi:hypothetical protein ACFC06_06925 [Nocardia sp. NPDC056064]|uniref:hypothetical protein n=1 Tax=Nocardia sp. NPDC056064 TaxID=3345701 RepID=UPI0035DBCE32